MSQTQTVVQGDTGIAFAQPSGGALISGGASERVADKIASDLKARAAKSEDGP